MIAPKIVLVLFFLTGIVSPNPVLNEQINSDAYRIKDSFKPTLYVITIDIRPMVIFTSNNNVITKASTVIFFDRLNKTDQVLEFHADTTYLKITDIYLSDGTSLGLSQCDRKTQICSVTLPKKLPDSDTDKFALTFVSNIKVSGDFQGLYKGKFDDPDNSGYFLATQFYPTYARRVFPCLDDPAFPAKFQFFIKADSYSHSVLTSTVNNDVFSQSPKMSTHSIGFVVMQLVPTGEKIDGDGTSHKVWTRPYVRQNGSFALYVAPKIMDEFGHYLGISYSSFGYNRSDEVAMPEINVGAIGNWGLTTFNEDELLFNDKEQSTFAQITIIQAIVREFAHMWFGNRVILEWWDVVFLNEGFAKYFQYFITQILYPEFEMDKRFVVDVLQKGLEADAIPSAKPLQSPCASVEEINSKFDDISIFKGASIIKMVSDIIGKDAFQRGLQEYVETKQIVRPKDLWQTLQKQVKDENVKLDEIMSEWVKKQGFPLVHVNLIDNKTVQLSQVNFQTNEPSKWSIPISFITDKDSSRTYWLKDNITISKNEQSKWVLSKNTEGFYRVNYDDQLWAELLKVFPTDESIDDISKAQIVDDIFALGRAGKMPYSKVFDNLQFLSTTKNYYVWKSAFRGFEYLLRRFGQDSKIGSYIIGFIRDMIGKFEYTTGSGLHVIKKSLEFKWQCRIGNKDAIKIAQDKFEMFINNKEPVVEVDFQEVIYCYGQSTATSGWSKLYSKFITSQFNKRILIKSMACGDKSNQNRLLELTKYDIRAQNKHVAFLAVLNRNVDVALEFFIKYVDIIQDQYPPPSLPTVISSLADAITSEKQMKQLEEIILSDHLQNVLTESLERTKENLQWSKKVEEELLKYFSPSSATSLSFSFYLIAVILIGKMI